MPHCGRRPAWPRVWSPTPRRPACPRGTRIRGAFVANCQPGEPRVVAALRTRRRGRARFKKPSSPRGQALRNARNAARTSGPTGKAADAGPGALQTRTFPAVWPQGGWSGAGPKSCARAARGRCGPRLRPRPCCGGPSNVPGHRRAAGAPALARDLPLST